MVQGYSNLINTFKNLDSIDKEEEITSQLEEIISVLNSINNFDQENIKSEELFLDDTYIKLIDVKEKITEFIKNAYNL